MIIPTSKGLYHDDMLFFCGCICERSVNAKVLSEMPTMPLFMRSRKFASAEKRYDNVIFVYIPPSLLHCLGVIVFSTRKFVAHVRRFQYGLFYHLPQRSVNPIGG